MSLPWFINGAGADAIPLDDRGLHYGHGLFETMRLHGGEIPLWPRHRRRLERDAKRLRIPLEIDSAERELAAALSHWPASGVVKLVVTAGRGGAGYRADATASAHRILGFRPLPPPRPELRVRLCTHPLSVNPGLAGIKHLNRLDQVLAAGELPEDREGLLGDGCGHLVEGLAGNLFVRIHGRWSTPLLDTAGVRGVMRELLLEELLPSLGIPVAERTIFSDELAAAEALFLCNAVRGVEPIAAVESLGLQLDIAPAQAIRGALEDDWPCFAGC